MAPVDCEVEDWSRPSEGVESLAKPTWEPVDQVPWTPAAMEAWSGADGDRYVVEWELGGLPGMTNGPSRR